MDVLRLREWLDTRVAGVYLKLKLINMKESNLSFTDGFLGIQSVLAKGKPQMKFDWDKAAEIIKEKLLTYPNLTAEAGLQGDWDYTGGIIFEESKPTNEYYTYLSSNWAVPTLILTDANGDEVYCEDCFITTESRFSDASKWDEQSLKILGISL